MGDRVDGHKLHRGALAGLWRDTLSQIPTLFGRLAYFASLRNPNTGMYEHHGMAALFGKEEAQRALAESHLETFAAWLNTSLEDQKSQLDEYLSTLGEDKAKVVATWWGLKYYRNLIPAGASDAETQLYLADLEALLDVLKLECGAVWPDPDA